MRTKRFYLGVIALVLAAFLGACTPPTINKETAKSNMTVLATADRGYALTVKDFYDYLYRSRSKVDGGYLTDAEARWMLDSLILDTLTGFAADDLDLGKYYHDYWTFKTRYTSIVTNEYFERNIAAKISVDTAEVLAYHKAHVDRYTLHEQAMAYHIMASPITFKSGPDSIMYRKMTPEQLDDAVRGHIEHLHRLIDSGMSFKEVAAKYSQDVTTKNEGGSMGWVTKGVFRPPFDSVLFALKPGEYSKPYRDQDGWHILMLADYLPAGPTPMDRPAFFDQVKHAVIGEHQAELAKKIADSLSKGADIQINQMVLDTDVFLVPDSLWCAVVNTVDTVDVQMIKTTDDAYRSRFRINNTTPEMKRAIITGYVNRLLMYQAARRDGLDTLPDIRNQRQQLWHAAGKSLLVRLWYDRAWRPSDSAIADYYAKHPNQFLVDKPLTVQQIVTKDSATALFLRDQAMAGVDFMQLAKEYYPGEPSVREALADLGKIGPRDVDSAFYMTAYGTNVGEVSPPVKSKYGYHIIKVLARNESKTLDNARIDIVKMFTDQYRYDEMQKRRAELSEKYHLRYRANPGKIFLEPVNYRTR
jgi:parvulin-like peptidyl-prolyl isomerase